MSKEHMGIGNYSGWHTDYRDGYRRDDEMYVYDQCCGNCALHGSEYCPMFIDEEEARQSVIESVENQRQEDAVIRDGEPQWCIYWQQHNYHKYHKHHGYHGHHGHHGYGGDC